MDQLESLQIDNIQSDCLYGDLNLYRFNNLKNLTIKFNKHEDVVDAQNSLSKIIKFLTNNKFNSCSLTISTTIRTQSAKDEINCFFDDTFLLANGKKIIFDSIEHADQKESDEFDQYLNQLSEDRKKMIRIKKRVCKGKVENNVSKENEIGNNSSTVFVFSNKDADKDGFNEKEGEIQNNASKEEIEEATKETHPSRKGILKEKDLTFAHDRVIILLEILITS